MLERECSLARVVVLFVLGVAFVVASLLVWTQTDLPKNEVVWGIWLGLGCVVWGVVWAILSQSTQFHEAVRQAVGLLAVVLALLVGAEYLTWERSGLYASQVMAVVSFVFGFVGWLARVSEPKVEPEEKEA